jgi:hypothetical protein
VNGTTPVFAPDGTILANTFQLHLDLYDLRAVERIRAKRQFYKENNQTAPPDDPDLQIPRVAHLRNISGLPVFPPHARNGEVVAAVQDNNVVVYSLRGNGWIRTGIDKGHASPVLALAFSESGRVFVSGSADAGVFLWDIKSKPGEREIASFVGVGEADYLVATADNYYMASKGALSRVSFVKEDNVYPFEQFDLRLNRPDLVLAKLGQAPPEMIAAVQEAWERRLRREGYNPDKQKTMRWYVPEIRVTDENRIQEVTHEAALTFTVEAKDEGYRIRSLHVSVNDVPLYGSRGLPVESANLSYPPPDGLGGMVTKQITVPLTAGRNRIQITATNIEGNESRRITYEINRKVSAPEPTTLYIVGIGVSQYKDDRIPDLNLAHKDANDIVELFRAAGSLPPLKAVPPKPTLIGPGLDIERVEYAPRYERVEPILLQDKDATRENILKIREKLLESQPQDHVIFFIAGHGFLDPKEMQYYFAVADTDMGNLGKTGISYAELEGILDGIPARQKLLLMDTCHSGEVDSENIGVLGTALLSIVGERSRSLREKPGHRRTRFN